MLNFNSVVLIVHQGSVLLVVEWL